MTIEPPQPPTAPAPAVRPTPPTPPRIDRTPFDNKSSADTTQGTEQVDEPEAMARDAVANGSGPLTKRTVTRDDNPQPSPPANQQVIVIPPDAPLVSDGQSDYDRGKDVLREFDDLDARESSANLPAQTATEQPRQISPRLTQQDGHGVVYWLFTIIVVAVAAFVIVKKFLLTDKPALTASELFADSSDRLRKASDKIKSPATKLNATTQVKPEPPRPSPSSDSDKGKHFEVRV